MSTKIVFSLACAVLILVIGTGCAGSPGIEKLSGDNGLEPLSGSGSNSQQTTGSGDQQTTSGGDGAIDSLGTVYPAQPYDNSAGSSDSSQPGGSVTIPVDWKTYTDPQFGFSISYPSNYIILDEIEKLTDVSPNMVLRVRFMDAELAHGSTANIEIPTFTIEIYENPSVTPLDSWISSHSSRGTLDPIKVDGVACTQLSLMTMQAPNQFDFCSKNNYVYKFIPVGLYSVEMLASFKFAH
jgi:hypothetical protein